MEVRLSSRRKRVKRLRAREKLIREVVHDQMFWRMTTILYCGGTRRSTYNLRVLLLFIGNHLERFGGKL